MCSTICAVLILFDDKLTQKQQIRQKKTKHKSILPYTIRCTGIKIDHYCHINEFTNECL